MINNSKNVVPSNAIASIFINNNIGNQNIKQINEIKKYASEISERSINVDETNYEIVKQFIINEMEKKNFCVALDPTDKGVGEGYVIDALNSQINSALMIISDPNLIETPQKNIFTTLYNYCTGDTCKTKMSQNKIIYSFALIQLEPERKVYIDLFCSYKAFVKVKNGKPVGGGYKLIRKLKDMAKAMKMTSLDLSAVPDAVAAYRKMGFKDILVHKKNNTEVKVSLINRPPEQQRVIRRRYSKKTIPDGDSKLYSMAMSVYTPDTSPILDVEPQTKKARSQTQGQKQLLQRITNAATKKAPQTQRRLTRSMR